MHCPSCRMEYRPGFSVCTDCGAALETGPVPTPPEKEEPAPGSAGRLEAIDTVHVLYTSQKPEADLAAGLLQAEGIPARSLLWSPAGLSEVSLGGGGSGGPWRCTVVVPASFERKAREILEGMGAILEPPSPPPPPQPNGPTPFGSSSPALSEAVAVVTLALVLLGVIVFLLGLFQR